MGLAFRSASESESFGSVSQPWFFSLLHPALAPTPGGLVEALALASRSPVWSCAGAITKAEFAARWFRSLHRYMVTSG